MSYILALDQGTTSSRSIIFDHAGSIVSVGQQASRAFCRTFSAANRCIGLPDVSRPAIIFRGSAV